MKLLPISPNLDENEQFRDHPDCRESLPMSIEYYRITGYQPPWITYFAELDGTIVGNAAFKGAPRENKVEIAYATFPKFRRQGVATRICESLVKLAAETDPEIRITARTLPEENYSTSVLRKNGFVLNGTIWDEDDGEVWEWEKK